MEGGGGEGRNTFISVPCTLMVRQSRKVSFSAFVIYTIYIVYQKTLNELGLKRRIFMINIGSSLPNTDAERKHLNPTNMRSESTLELFQSKKLQRESLTPSRTCSFYYMHLYFCGIQSCSWQTPFRSSANSNRRTDEQSAGKCIFLE